MSFLGVEGGLDVRRESVSGSQSGVDTLIRFCPKEIAKMTKNFSRKTFVHRTEYTYLYKCSLPDGKIVAVKLLDPGTVKGEPEFMALVDIMTRANRPNLISFLGYCIDKSFQILVFEFAENKNLSYHLHGERGLSWDIRFKIAKGVARALSYLHHECHPQIIHRDIKPANILLNSSFDAQVADFGFTKLEDKRCPYVVTCLIKTIGYVAPEYALSADLTDKSDVYSFGIILIEILTGRPPVRKRSDPLEVPWEWAIERITDGLENGNFSEFVDPRLSGEYKEEEVRKMAKVILECTKYSPNDRSTMAQVLKSLEGEPHCYFGRETSMCGDSNADVGEPSVFSYADAGKSKAEAYVESY